MLKKIFCVLISFFFCLTNYALSDNIDFSLLGERSKKDFKQKQDRKHVYKGNYASLFVSKSSRRQIVSWIGVSGYKYRLDAANAAYFDNEVNSNYFSISNDYSDINNNKFTLKIYFPHPKYEQQAEYGLFPLYIKLDNVKQKLSQKEKILIQNKYPATIYEFNDKSCSICIEMPHQVRVYVNGTCKDKPILIDFYNQLSLDRFKEKLEDD